MGEGSSVRGLGEGRPSLRVFSTFSKSGQGMVTVCSLHIDRVRAPSSPRASQIKYRIRKLMQLLTFKCIL